MREWKCSKDGLICRFLARSWLKKKRICGASGRNLQFFQNIFKKPSSFPNRRRNRFRQGEILIEIFLKYFVKKPQVPVSAVVIWSETALCRTSCCKKVLLSAVRKSGKFDSFIASFPRFYGRATMVE